MPPGSSWAELEESVARAVFLFAGPVLWFLGARLFVRSSLTRAKKIGWAALLVVLGAGIGVLLPLPAIRSRFLLLLLILPLLAYLDVKIARSRRSFSFWLRACGFEVCTVFGSAAILRLCLDLLRRGS